MAWIPRIRCLTARSCAPMLRAPALLLGRRRRHVPGYRVALGLGVREGLDRLVLDQHLPAPDLEPRSSWAREAASRAEAKEANASRSRYCERASFSPPATFSIALICASPPTRDTDRPTLMAGRTPELNRSVSRKICPSVMEMTLVGM